ncbi:MAG: MBOAT family protein [Candidatus Melainabacteria bacterium]
MVFSSWIYVLFLAIVVLLYWNVPQRFRVPLLLIASYVFYMTWSPPFGVIYAPVIFLDSAYFYWLSVLMEKHPERKKQILVFGVTTELCLLGFFKYSNFLLGNLDALCAALHQPVPGYEMHLFLPLAISFTNFILIAYLVDVYRGIEKPDTFIRFSTYVAFFPHLIAGPIVRASELLHQFDSNPPWKQENFTRGVHKFLQGLAMKVFVADLVAKYVNTIYGDTSLQGFDSSWLATYAFAVQIFCDFAGYTLMAQGSALLMGYTLPENFNAPYFAQNITDFWRRWHMSLSRWLKDYLYISLGGSRCSKLMTYRNLFLTMGLGGLWHGASWNFVIWGLLHGLYLSVHKFFMAFRINRFIPTLMAWFITFHAVCLAWVFFRAQTFPAAWHMIQTMFNPATMVGINTSGKMALGVIGLFFMVHAGVRFGGPKVENKWVVAGAQGVAYFILIYLGMTLKTNAQEFIYFQF